MAIMAAKSSQDQSLVSAAAPKLGANVAAAALETLWSSPPGRRSKLQ